MFKQCNKCSKKFKAHEDDFTCPYCGSFDLTEIYDEKPINKPKEEEL